MEQQANILNKDTLRRIVGVVGSAGLILFAVFCVVGAVASSLLYGVKVADMLLAWSAAAAAMSVLVSLLRGKGFVICTAIVLLLALYRLPGIVEGAKWFIFTVTNETNKYFNVKVLLLGTVAAKEEIDLFITIVGLILMLPLSAAICLRRSCSYTVLITVPFALPTLALNDNPPNILFLIGLIAVYLVLLFSTVLHPNDFAKRGAAVFPSIAVVAILLGITYFLTPSDNLSRGNLIQSIDSRIRRHIHVGNTAVLPGVGWPDNTSGGWKFNTANVAIADAGPRYVSDEKILEVTTTLAGTFYLRGYSMNLFDGRSWQSRVNNSFDQDALTLPALIVEKYGEIYPKDAPTYASILIRKTGDQSFLDYYPYYSLHRRVSSILMETNNSLLLPDSVDSPVSDFTDATRDMFGLGDRSSGDPGSGRTETIKFFHTNVIIPDAAALLSAISLGNNADYIKQMSEMARQGNLQVEPETADRLRLLASRAGIRADADRVVIADQVAEYISSSARYTLSPPTTPEGEDFAIHFLQTARRGYCVHFATAATLMLRALDVPARFTCGFTVTVTERDVGVPITLTDRNAHAWVEVFYDNVGWIPLEVSPSTAGYDVPERTPYSAVRESYSYDDRTMYEDMFEDMDYTPASPQQLDRPGGTTDSDDTAKPTNGSVVAVSILACASACVFALFVHRSIACRKRAKGFNQSDANAAVLYVWRYISRLRRLRMGRIAQPPEEVEELAMKARFSNHSMSEYERTVMLRSAADMSSKVSINSSPLRRAYMKYVRALI